MNKYSVTVGLGGSGTFKVEVHAPTPERAREAAEHLYPGYKAQAVKQVYN